MKRLVVREEAEAETAESYEWYEAQQLPAPTRCLQKPHRPYSEPASCFQKLYHPHPEPARWLKVRSERITN